MSQYLKVASLSDFINKNHKCFRYLARTIAIIKETNKSYYAIEANCKHQNANLLSQGLKGEIIVCPRHGWKYNIKTGECLTESWAYLKKFPLKIVEKDIFVDVMNPIDTEPN